MALDPNSAELGFYTIMSRPCAMLGGRRGAKRLHKEVNKVAAANVQFGLFTYTDGQSRSWTIRCDKVWGNNANSGLAALANPPAPRMPHFSKRYHCRYALFYDPATLRTIRKVAGNLTSAAATGVLAGNTFTYSREEPGEAAAVVYNWYGLYPEHLPGTKPGVNFPEHA